MLTYQGCGRDYNQIHHNVTAHDDAIRGHSLDQEIMMSCGLNAYRHRRLITAPPLIWIRSDTIDKSANSV